MQTIYLDITNRGVIPVIYAKQNDVGRKIEVVLTNSGLPYEPEAGSAFSAWYSGASGMGNYTHIGDRSAFSVSGNKVTVELIAQMLQNGGEGFLCLVLSRVGGEQIGLWNIRYICEGIPGAGSEAAQQYYTAFSQTVADLAYPDASLSVAGKAADAAATGEALKGKAPAGYVDRILYGATYDEWYATLQEVYNAMTNGTRKIYNIGLGKKQSDGGVQNGSWTVEFTRYYADYGFIKIWNNDYPTGLVLKIMGSWGEWEWVNPPMVQGVEYRTTERWHGNPVYTALIFLGNMPDGQTYKNVEFAVSGGQPQPFFVTGMNSVGSTLPAHYGDGNSQYISAEPNDAKDGIRIRLKNGVASWTAVALVKYIKA